MVAWKYGYYSDNYNTCNNMGTKLKNGKRK